MRIAISGSHRVGKTTLAEALAEALPKHELVPEPYYALEEEGHEFAEQPSLEDFELQLERSLKSLQPRAANRVFDRCPLDMIAYLLAHEDAGAFQLDDWMPRVHQLLPTLDLIVYVPIEQPDRIPVDRSEQCYRDEVDAVLRDIVLDDAYGLDVDVISVAGTEGDRLKQVLSRVRRPSK